MSTSTNESRTFFLPVTGVLTGLDTDALPDDQFNQPKGDSRNTLDRVFYPEGYNPSTAVGSPIGDLGVIDPVKLWSSTGNPNEDDFVLNLSVAAADGSPAVARFWVADPSGLTRFGPFELPIAPASPFQANTRYAIPILTGDRVFVEWATPPAAPGANIIANLTPAASSDLSVALMAAASSAEPAFAGIGAMRNVGLVNPDTGDDATGAIGTTLAFKTIQGFIDAVPPGNDSAGARNVYVAQISPGDYDEDLAIDISRRRIILTGPGPWNLGTFGAGDWGPSGTPRNIVVTGAAANIDGIRPGLVITNNLPLSEGMTTHESYLTRPRISGFIDLRGVGAIGSVELALTCEIFAEGTGVCIEAGTAIVQSYMYHCRMRGRLAGTNWQFQVASRCRFDGEVGVDNYSLIQSCRFDDGMSIAGSGFAGVRPNGILLTTFDGTYTGGPGTFNCDGYTNAWQKINNPAGVTVLQKTILGDLVP